MTTLPDDALDGPWKLPGERVEALGPEPEACAGDDCPELASLKDSYGQLRAWLVHIMRAADAAKEPCGMDPESPAAIRNGKFASIAHMAAQALGLVRGPALAAQPSVVSAQVAKFEAMMLAASLCNSIDNRDWDEDDNRVKLTTDSGIYYGETLESALADFWHSAIQNCDDDGRPLEPDPFALAAQPAAEARPVALTYPSRQSLFLRACGHPSVLEIMADCADCIDTENDAQHDPECGAYDGSKWRALAAELRRSAAAIRAEDPEIWSDAPPARPVAPAGWLPIETAPKDGSVLLTDGVTSSEGGWVSDIEHGAEWEGQLGMAGWWSVSLTGKPTGWMPLPPPPGASATAPMAPVALTEEQTFEPISDHEQAALYRHCEGTDHYPVVRRLYRNSCKLPPDLFERERAATICDDLAEMMERGAGECAPGERLRQAARNIREGRPPLSDVCISAPSAEG